MRSRYFPLLFLFFLPLTERPANSGQNLTGDLDALIAKAAEAKDPVLWAQYLMRADAVAEKLVLPKRGGCCGQRCVRAGSFELHYRYNDIEGQEDYQHDLLQVIAQIWAGTPQGAEALGRLLPTGCQTIASVWTPYFKTVLGILEFRPWRATTDPRLIRIKAEAYETWWSLSKTTPDDPILHDHGFEPGDFQEGANLARERAIAGYQALVKSGHANSEIANRLRKLKAGEDTDQRTWLCAED